MATITAGRTYTGPKLSSTRVVSGSPVAVKSTGQTLTRTSGSARTYTPTPAPKEVSIPGSSTQKTTTTPTTFNKYGQPVSSAYATPGTVLTSTGYVSTATPQAYAITHPGTLIPTTSTTTTSGGGTRTATSATPTTTIRTTTTSGTTITKTGLPEPTPTQPTSTYKYTPAILPSTYAGTYEDTLRASGMTPAYGTQYYQTTMQPLDIINLNKQKPKPQIGPTNANAIAQNESTSGMTGTFAMLDAIAGKNKNIRSQSYSPISKEGLSAPQNKSPSQLSIAIAYNRDIKQIGVSDITFDANGAATVSYSPSKTAPSRFKQDVGVFGGKYLIPFFELAQKTSPLGMIGVPRSEALNKQIAGAEARFVVGVLSKPIESSVATAALFTPAAPYAAAYWSTTVFGAVGKESVDVIGKSIYVSPTDKGYSEAVTKAWAAQESSDKTFGISYSLARSPTIIAENLGLKGMSGKEAFVESFTATRREQGFTDEQIKSDLRIALGQRTTGAFSEAAGFIAASANIEAKYKTIFATATAAKGLQGISGSKGKIIFELGKTVAPRLAVAGFTEGLVQTRIAASTEGRIATTKESYVGGAWGSASASIMGTPVAIKGLLNKGGVARGLIGGLELTGNIADYSEKFGDWTADVGSKVSSRITGVRTIEPGVISLGGNKYAFDSSSFKVGKPSVISTPVRTPSIRGGSLSGLIVGLPNNKITSNIGGRKIPSIGSLTSKTPSDSIVTSPSVNIPSLTRSSIQVPSNVPVPVPANVPVPVPSNVPSQVPSLVTVPVFTPQNFGLPFPIGAGWGDGFGQGSDRLRKKKGKYQASFMASYLGIYGKAPKTKGGVFTGQEFRPLIGKAPKKVRFKKPKGLLKKSPNNSFSLGKVMARI